MKKILQKEEKVLRQVAKEIKISDIKSLKTKRILKEMSAALKSQSDGVAIAAPQIGYSLRIFLVSGRIFSKDFTQKDGSVPEEDEPEVKKPVSPLSRNGLGDDLVFINPKISRLSRDKEWLPEGCLSVRPLYGKTFRSKKATVSAYDENGKKFERGASGLLAQIFQHETDHLNGILFIDHAKDVKAENPTT